LQRRVYAWPIAAGLLLASLVAYWLVQFPYDVRSLAVSTPYPMAPPQLRSPQMPEPLVTAVRAYSQNNWPEAEADLTRFLAGNPADYEATFYLANVFYVRGRLAESERLFRELNRRDPRDRRVQWYLANLRLRAGDSAGAARHLEMIRESPGEYRSEAESLLRRLRR
jgi:tetratricopeptide (TPR) repeat protein